MAHMMIVKRDVETGNYLALLHRRARGIREAYCWGIPGGALEKDEKDAIRSVRGEERKRILRRAALRECIGATGGGRAGFTRAGAQSRLTLDPLNVPGVRSEPIAFPTVCTPPGMDMLIDNPLISATFTVIISEINVPTTIVMYMLHPMEDVEFLGHWLPRALPKWKSEIDEAYQKGGCKHGYVWVEIEQLIRFPRHPVEASSTPLCGFLIDFFAEHGDAVREHLVILDERCNAPKPVNPPNPPTPPNPPQSTDESLLDAVGRLSLGRKLSSNAFESPSLGSLSDPGLAIPHQRELRSLSNPLAPVGTLGTFSGLPINLDGL